MGIQRLQPVSGGEPVYVPQPIVNVSVSYSTTNYGVVNITGKGRLDYLVGAGNNSSYNTIVTIAIDGGNPITLTAIGGTNTYLFLNGTNSTTTAPGIQLMGLNMKFKQSLSIQMKSTINGAGSMQTICYYSLEK